MKERAIIAQTLPPRDWDGSAADIITDPAELLRLVQLDSACLPAALAASQDFPLRVPRSYVRQMRLADPADPLLLQVLSRAEELDEVPGYSADPLEEAEHTPVPGILHKYHGRVLLMVTGACAIHCRYCFRRHFPYNEHLPTRDRLAAALDWLAGQTDVSEVILSGGDPLSVTDRRLGELLAALQAIPHLKRLRIHSRLPVVMPERVSEGLLAMLGSSRLKPVMVVHANHGAELGSEAGAALAALGAAGVQLLNQSVLLRGVNDDVTTLAALSERLLEVGVLPYYLHQLDRVAGAAHFAVSDQQALQLIAELHARLPGYLVPKLVREESGAAGKTLLETSG
ncbi:MAG: EF-P beta-lysylation protein EpmB [Alcanivoracaceae bacterium]|nr:EF-P beta-lysylation protein EpmB [Alcanivoracaceae bacterium]